MIKLNLPELGETATLLIDSGYEIPTAIKNDMASSCNNSNGCINVWQNGNIIICELGRFCETVNHKEFELSEMDEVVGLFDKWLSEII